MINNTQGLGYSKAENIVAVLTALRDADIYDGMLALQPRLWETKKLDV